jgi:putative two-component system response regulator
MLLDSGPDFDLAAAAAYEHHVRPDGSGYPELRPGHEPHYVSRIVAVCDAYDALRSPRSYRPAWSPEQAVQHVEDGAGGVFDRGVAKSFSAMIRRLEDRLVRIRPEQDDVPSEEDPASPGATRTA